MDRVACAIEVLDELADAVLVAERLPFVGAGVLDRDPHAAVEERQLLQPLDERRVAELRGLEDLRVGLEGGLGSNLVARAGAAHRALRHAAGVLLVMNAAVAADLYLGPLGQEVHDRHADAVQAAGSLVGALAELAAELEDSHHAFKRADIAARLLRELFVSLDGDAAAVVHHRDRVIRVDGDRHLVGVARHGLVDRVVNHLVHQMVEAAHRCVTDVHARALTDVLQVREVLEVFLVVFRVGFCHLPVSELWFGVTRDRRAVLAP